MDFRQDRTHAITAVPVLAEAGGPTAVEPEIPPAVAKRIASAVRSSRSEGTRKTYAAAWRRFTGWCESNGHVTLPAHPMTVAAYRVDAADTRTESGERAYAVATFGTWIAAISHQHRTTGHLSPSAYELVTATCRGYGASTPQPGTDPAPRETRCWSTTSSCSSRPRGNGVKAGPTRSSNAAIRQFCSSGSPVPIAAASCRRWCAGTSLCIGMTGCTSGYGSRRRTKRAGERSRRCRTPTRTRPARRARTSAGFRSSPRSMSAAGRR